MKERGLQVRERSYFVKDMLNLIFPDLTYLFLCPIIKPFTNMHHFPELSK